MTVMVELDRLSKRFGHFQAVEDISLTVAKGEVLGFLGPNGAGKTTTMRMIAGFLTPTSGTARVCGRDVATEPTAVKALLGYMSEGAPAYDDMTVQSFLKFIAEIRGIAGADIERRVRETAAKVDIVPMLDRPIEVLSKGYKRRVGLAQALLHDPPVLILDEPTDGLDPNQKHQVRSLIKAMAQEKCIVISTHILEEVRAVCTRAVIIGRGKLLADGTADQLLARLPDHHAVLVETAPEHAERVATALGRISGAKVDRVPTTNGRTCIRVVPSGAQSILETVSATVRSENLPVLEIYQNRGDLDDAFRLITTGAIAAPDRAAA